MNSDRTPLAAHRGPAGTAVQRQRVGVAEQHDVYNAAVLAYALVQQAGARPLLATEAATMVSELGMNIVKYAGRGSLTLSVADDPQRYLEVLAVDDGPGIADLALALTERYSSQGTLGLGLPGVRRMSDEFELKRQEVEKTYSHLSAEEVKELLEDKTSYGETFFVPKRARWNEGYVDEEGRWQPALKDVKSNIGERLMAVRHLLEGEEAFFANYTDGLTDMDLDRQLAHFNQRDAVGSLLLVRPTNQSFHFAEVDHDDRVSQITAIRDSAIWVNGGFFVLEPAVMEYIAGDSTVWEQDPLERLAQSGALSAYKHEGFWQPMDTLRDKNYLEGLWDSGKAPWKVW